MTNQPKSVFILTLLFVLATPALGQFPDAPSHSKLFWTLTAANAGALAFDGVGTLAWKHLRYDRPYTCTSEAASPLLYGTHPTPGRTAAVMGGEFVVNTAAGYFLRKSHNKVLRRLWWVPQAVSTGTHLTAGLKQVGC